MSNANSISIDASEDVAVRAVNKRYEGLVTVRTKAVKGKGAWYWAHLEPILIRNPDTDTPKAVKLKCTLCDSAFSASNPSRTATEHLKRGTCPNFSLMLKPISQLPPLASPSSQQNHRKRNSLSQEAVGPLSNAYPISMVDSSRFNNETSFLPPAQSSPFALKPLVLSGGKEDLGPLALLENSVKKLKSPKASPSPTLSKDRINKAFDFLADWFYESCGSVSFSNLEHPKFKAFLNQVGLPAVSILKFSTSRLDSKFEEAKMESEARIRDATFFQIASDGWKSKNCSKLVKFIVNLPNGTRVFQKAVYSDGGTVASQNVEEILLETIQAICGNDPQRCAGVVSDKFKAKALRNLELQNHWMVNLSCQFQGFLSLIKDFYRELPLFRTVSGNSLKIANFINSTPQIRNSFHKFQGFDLDGFIRVPPNKSDISKNLSPFIAMLDDLLSCSRILHLIILDDSYKSVSSADIPAREVADVIQDVSFWNNVEAAHSLLKMITTMATEMETERPLVSQCLPLWEELRAKIKDWCSKYNFPEGPVEKIFEKRFNKNYHPAWSAAFILDPLYLVRDGNGKYLPPFKFLTNDQEKDIDKLLTRLVSQDEAHIALMELMKWRSEGLDPLYAQAVQVKERDPLTGKMKIANPQSSRLVWETCLKLDFKSLGRVATRLLFLHATSSCGVHCDSSCVKWLGSERAQKMFFVGAHEKLKRRDFCSKDGEGFGEDDLLVNNEVLADTSSI